MGKSILPSASILINGSNEILRMTPHKLQFVCLLSKVDMHIFSCTRLRARKNGPRKLELRLAGATHFSDCLLEIIAHRAGIVLLDDLHHDGAVLLGLLGDQLIGGAVLFQALFVVGHLLANLPCGLIPGKIVLQLKMQSLADAGCLDSFHSVHPPLLHPEGVASASPPR